MRTINFEELCDIEEMVEDLRTWVAATASSPWWKRIKKEDTK